MKRNETNVDKISKTWIIHQHGIQRCKRSLKEQIHSCLNIVWSFSFSPVFNPQDLMQLKRDLVKGRVQRNASISGGTKWNCTKRTSTSPGIVWDLTHLLRFQFSSPGIVWGVGGGRGSCWHRLSPAFSSSVQPEISHQHHLICYHLTKLHLISHNLVGPDDYSIT